MANRYEGHLNVFPQNPFPDIFQDKLAFNRLTIEELHVYVSTWTFDRAVTSTLSHIAQIAAAATDSYVCIQMTWALQQLAAYLIEVFTVASIDILLQASPTQFEEGWLVKVLNSD